MSSSLFFDAKFCLPKFVLPTSLFLIECWFFFVPNNVAKTEPNININMNVYQTNLSGELKNWSILLFHNFKTVIVKKNELENWQQFRIQCMILAGRFAEDLTETTTPLKITPEHSE